MVVFTRNNCFILTCSSVCISLVLVYYSRSSIGSMAGYGMAMSAERIEEIEQAAFSMAEKWNSDRKTRISQVCNRIRNDIPQLDAKSNANKHIIVDRKHRIMYCPVPKAACTTWKGFFFQLRWGKEPDADIHTQERTSLIHLMDLDPIERETVMKNYTKFLIVRHPFTRILSAYRNKLEPNGSYETTHADVTKKYYWRKNIGANILEMYRGKRIAKKMMKNPAKYDLTFREFVDYISNYKRKAKANDRHWKEVFEICFPCDIEYDFVAKVETLPQDTIYFLLSNGFSDHVTNYQGHATNSSSMTALTQFYNNLPIESIEALYQRYKFDFQLFDYDPRSFN
ncbi:carbohydrate sulfotransferase 11-like [Apostichopus japonicus]|uniref:carbohydrate sulfotransferase 11-like n=1 Tax=Stichopus japonicus TaxID=307972 RepID=UPI003AB6F872